MKENIFGSKGNFIILETTFPSVVSRINEKFLIYRVKFEVVLLRVDFGSLALGRWGSVTHGHPWMGKG